MVYTVIKSMEKATRDGDDEYSDERPLQSSHATAERGSRTARTEESRVRRTKSNPAVRKRQQAEGMGRAKRRLFDSAPELLSRRKKNNQPWRCLAGPQPHSDLAEIPEVERYTYYCVLPLPTAWVCTNWLCKLPAAARSSAENLPRQMPRFSNEEHVALRPMIGHSHPLPPMASLLTHFHFSPMSDAEICILSHHVLTL